MVHAQNRNRLRHHAALQAIRKQLNDAEILMERGISLEPDTNKSFYTGFEDQTLYDWDQYFEAIIQTYMGWPDHLIKNGVTIFLDHQQQSGLISRSIPSNIHHDAEHVKPFLCQTILLVEKHYEGDLDWVLNDTYYPRLKKYLDYWLHEMDQNDNGLSAWMSAPHSGLKEQHERAGCWEDRICEGVDLNSYLYLELLAFAQLAASYGAQEDATTYGQLAEQRKERIQSLLWDERDGFYYDRHVDTGAPIRFRSIAGFTPLWAGLCTQEQADRLVEEHLQREEAFWSPWPVATVSREEPGHSGNGRATVWIPTNYMLYHGLKRYDHDALAASLATHTQTLVQRAGAHAYYDAERGIGWDQEPCRGGSLLAHFMDFEAQYNVTPYPKLELS